MLPGQTTGLVEPCQCERCDKPATVRFCTESDSFGDELTPMCGECADEYQNKPPLEMDCDFCKKLAVVHPMRDTLEEGTHGRVYYVCQPCQVKYDETVAEAYEEMEREEDRLCW